MARKKATEGTYKKAKPTTSRGNRAKTKPVDEIVPKEIEEEIKIKKYKVKIRKVEDNAIIVNIAGYSKRVYFDLTFNDLDYLRKNKKAFTNRIVDIYYIGDISDAFKVTILPLKGLEDIGSGY